MRYFNYQLVKKTSIADSRLTKEPETMEQDFWQLIIHKNAPMTQIVMEHLEATSQPLKKHWPHHHFPKIIQMTQITMEHVEETSQTLKESSPRHHFLKITPMMQTALTSSHSQMILTSTWQLRTWTWNSMIILDLALAAMTISRSGMGNQKNRSLSANSVVTIPSITSMRHQSSLGKIKFGWGKGKERQNHRYCFSCLNASNI